MNNTIYIMAAEDYAETEEYGCPDPKEKSWALFEVVSEPEAKFSWQRVRVEEVFEYAGGAADYEHGYGAGLEYTIGELLDSDTPDGIYVIEGFELDFTKDYYGEVDCDAYYEEIRPATPEEAAGAFGASFWDSDEVDRDEIIFDGPLKKD